MYILLKNKKINIKTCKNIFQRIIGFAFKIEPVNYGLFFPNASSIHTFFMYQPIDVAMTDEKNKIIYLYQRVKPWNIIWPKKDVTNIYEFQAGMLDEYSVNDTLKIKTN
jgi:hypothetical protein